MKKWTVIVPLALSAVVACGRNPAPGTAMTGAAAPRLAVEQFMSAVKAQDLQAMSVVWGTDKGPARDQIERGELEKREIIMQACYDHERFRILEEGPAPNGERVIRVEVTRGSKTATPSFMVVRGPSDRWYVRDAGIATMKDFCKGS